MMRLWPFIVALTFATLLGVVISKDPGYALFAYGDWAVEMPLWVSAVLLVFIVFATLFIIWFFNTIFYSSTKIKQWWKKHQETTARKQTYRGLLELAAGRWKKAERYLIQSALNNEMPLINYLSAAKAAEEGGSPERRDHYLQLAFDASAGSNVAVRLTQAQLQLEHGDLKQSIRNLERLHEDAPKHPKVLRLLCSLYEMLNDWQSLYALLPTLRKSEVLSSDALARIEQKVYPALLPLYTEKSLKALTEFWHSSPSSIQTNPKNIALYAKILIKKGAIPETEALLRTTLKRIWSHELVSLYGILHHANPKKSLTFLEDFLSEYYDDPILLLAVGRLCLKNQLWGKARDYLEKSLNIKPMPETFAELAQLMEQLGLSEKRDEYFKKGLLFATQHLVSTQSDLLCLN